MQIDDTNLLAQYVADGSQDAFGQIVRRYIDMVYAAARRQTRRADMAEDVTQAVFITLARKASKVRAGALAAWLLSTTRYAASNAIKLETRRRAHEQKAAAMKPMSQEPDPVLSEQEASINHLLDEALAKLSATDRGAVAMRFFQSKSLRDIGEALGISEVAAQKRVQRAIDRLRDFFARRGMALSIDSVSSSLTRQTSTLAPTALTSVVISVSMHGATAASGAGGAMAIANGVAKTFFWAPAKIATAACVTVALVAGTRAVIASKSQPEPSRMAVTATTQPTQQTMWTPAVASVSSDNSQRLTNHAFSVGNAGHYDWAFDENVVRNPYTKEWAGVIRSNAMAVTADQTSQRYWLPFAAPFHGKRLRIAAWLKSQDVERTAGLNVIIYGPGGRVDAQDDMADRPIVGTTAWKRYETVVDIQNDTELISVGVNLKGRGTLWFDEFSIEVVGKDVAPTDDQRWHIWGLTSANYRAAPDPTEQRDGHPTICIRSDNAGPKEWVLYDHLDRSASKMVGKRLKMSAMIKVEGAGGSRLSMRAVGANFKTLGQDEGYGRHAASGSMDWMRYSIFLNVPEETQAISSGVVLYGKGKLWIDDVKYEIVDAPATRK